MAKDNSFDIEAGVDRQEVDNAINQASREVATRFDFRDTETEIAWAGEDGHHHRVLDRGPRPARRWTSCATSASSARSR